MQSRSTPDSNAPKSKFYYWIWIPIIVPLIIWGVQYYLTHNSKPDHAPEATRVDNTEKPSVKQMGNPEPKAVILPVSGDTGKQTSPTKKEPPDPKTVILPD